MLINLDQAYALTDKEHKQQAYCALDCTGTLEIHNVLAGRMNESQKLVYAFERALQAPCLDMMRRGIKVNVQKRTDLVTKLNRDLAKAVRAIDKLPLIQSTWDGTEKETGKCKQATRKDGKHKWSPGKETTTDAEGNPTTTILPESGRSCLDCGSSRLTRSPFNPNSSHQCKRLFYELLGAPEQRNKTKEVSTDEDCLLRIGEAREDLRPLTDAILEVRNFKKQIGFLNARLTPDGRYPTSISVGAAWTGRFASSKSGLGGGGNVQNIGSQHRYVFEADPGWTMCYADLERAESWVVAMLSGDQGYIEAHEGDTHTYVCRLIWPNDLPWTGDIKADKKIASSMRPPWDDVEGHDYRFQSKRMQHGSNYGLSPFGISMINKIPLVQARRAQYAYFDAFPHIRGWQDWTKKRVSESRELVNPLGRAVRLFGRPWDPHTHKQGLAFVPQSTVADLLNLALWRVWRHHADKIQLLAQVHDAILCQWRTKDEEAASAALKSCMSIPTPVTDYQGVTRTLTIPVEIATGRNWGKRDPETNPYGLK